MRQLDWNTKKVTVFNTKLASSGRDTLHPQGDTLPLYWLRIFQSQIQAGKLGTSFFSKIHEKVGAGKKTCEDRSVWCHLSWSPFGGSLEQKPTCFWGPESSYNAGIQRVRTERMMQLGLIFFLLVLQFGRKWGATCCFKDRFRSIIRSYYRGAAGMLLVPDLALVGTDVGNHWKKTTKLSCR